MPDEPRTHIVSDAEITAALAEAEATTAAIPSLDDGSGARFVPVPVPALPRPLSQVSLPASGDSAAPPAATSTAADTAKSAASRSSPGGPLAATRVPWSAWPYRATDQLLWVINRPFDGLTLPARRLLGWAAVVTILMAGAATILLPRLLPRTDPLIELSRRSAALRAAPAETPRDTQRH